MTIRQEFNSWFAPPHVELASAPKPGDKAPSSEELQIPGADGRPIIVTFLRHCGCPFAERDFKSLRLTADANPYIRCVTVSHSSNESTQKWLQDVGGSGRTEIIVDDGCKIYAKWGLGTAGWLHLFNPTSFREVYKLRTNQGISNRPTESGSRWQTAGSWAVDNGGVVKWGGPAVRSDEERDFEAAIRSLSSGESKL